MLSAIQRLKVGEEISVHVFGPIERRVRRKSANMYQVFDINWQAKKVWHVCYSLNVRSVSCAAEISPSVFKNSWSFEDGPKATGYQSRQNRILKQRIFHDAKRRQVRDDIRQPALMVINGGKVPYERYGH